MYNKCIFIEREVVPPIYHQHCEAGMHEFYLLSENFENIGTLPILSEILVSFNHFR